MGYDGGAAMIAFTVPGHPQPKQRPRFGRRSVYTPEATRAYEKFVGYCARQAMQGEMLRGPVAVDMVVWTRGKADVDNLAKAVLDGMRGIVYEDDSQVVHLSVTRCVDDNERVDIWVGEWVEEAS